MGEGIYGAVSYYPDSDDQVYLIGGDYSWQLRDVNQLFFQFEYLDDGAMIINSLLGGIDLETEERNRLLVGMINYELDDFSSLQLNTTYSLDDGSLMLAPGYSNQVASNLDFEINGGFFIGDEGELFGSGGRIPQRMVEVKFSYPF
ncbi:hypothetical protein MWH28_11045 [Natroniella sulfidigena]|uniref:hypothetical protein n=1 Tax=Natroniella sulfidigena TaxID=723921 RepID=UPI00200B1DF7|nr:hypothetical protein [Natroniella sulfidigena]MCK8817900.1 hypothetical protein [Natroniella sulfidigena]